MKRKLLAVALASLFALPAFAMDRDVPYPYGNHAPSDSASASQPRDALIAEGRAGEAVLEQLGWVYRNPAHRITTVSRVTAH